MNLRQALLGCPVGLLHKMAREYALRTDAATLRSELVAALTTTIAERASQTDFWEGLNGSEATAASIVARSERGVEADTLLRRLAADPSLTGVGVGEPGAAVARLVERGLLFRIFQADGPVRGTYLAMPEEIVGAARARLRGGSRLSTLATQGAPAERRHGDLGRDLFALASALRREVWSAAARPSTGRSERRLGAVLARLESSGSERDPRARRERWAFLVELGRRGGWLRAGGWPTPVDERVRVLLADAPRLHEALWRTYLAAPRGGSSRRLAPTVEDGLLQALGEVEDGTWLDVVALATELAALATAGPAVSGSPATDRRGTPPDAAAVGSLLAGPWTWLGLVDWGRTADGWTLIAAGDGLRAVVGQAAVGRAIAGRAVAGPGDGTRATSPLPCRLHDVLTLSAPEGADLVGLYDAEPYLAFERGGQDRSYRLTAGSFARGCRLGGSADAFLELLANLAQTDPPPRWTAALGAWTATARRARVRARIVLEVDDGAELERIRSALGDLAGGLEPLSERHAAIRPDALADVLRRLGDAGIAPDVGAELRLDGQRPGRAAALGGEGADLVWVLVEALRRLDPDLLARDPALGALADALDAVVPASARQPLERRVGALVARLAERRARRPPAG